jgi:hypothetical protein
MDVAAVIAASLEIVEVVGLVAVEMELETMSMSWLSRH